MLAAIVLELLPNAFLFGRIGSRFARRIRHLLILAGLFGLDLWLLFSGSRLTLCYFSASRFECAGGTHILFSLLDISEFGLSASRHSSGRFLCSRHISSSFASRTQTSNLILSCIDSLLQGFGLWRIGGHHTQLFLIRRNHFLNVVGLSFDQHINIGVLYRFKQIHSLIAIICHTFDHLLKLFEYVFESYAIVCTHSINEPIELLLIHFANVLHQIGNSICGFGSKQAFVANFLQTALSCVVALGNIENVVAHPIHVFVATHVLYPS